MDGRCDDAAAGSDADCVHPPSRKVRPAQGDCLLSVRIGPVHDHLWHVELVLYDAADAGPVRNVAGFTLPVLHQGAESVVPAARDEIDGVWRVGHVRVSGRTHRLCHRDRHAQAAGVEAGLPAAGLPRAAAGLCRVSHAANAIGHDAEGHGHGRYARRADAWQQQQQQQRQQWRGVWAAFYGIE